MTSTRATDAVGFGDRLDGVFASLGHLCVGLDPHPYLLDKWNFADNARDLREFSYRVIDATVGHAGILKPQVAFYERHGFQGFQVLEQVMERARSAELLVIADAKRGDIGSTMEAYASTWLSAQSPLEADALTVSPYLGVDALEQTVDIALNSHKGIFILAATSNPEATAVQSARMVTTTKSPSLAQHVLEHASAQSVERIPHMSVGVVIGATVDFADVGLDVSRVAAVPTLVPGIGFQGGTLGHVSERFGPLMQRIIVSETRSLLEVGREGVAEAIARRAAEVADALG